MRAVGRPLPRDDAALLDLIVDHHIDLDRVQNKNDLLEGSARLPQGDRRIWLGPRDAYTEMASMVRSDKIRGARALPRDQRDKDKVEEFEALRDLVAAEARPKLKRQVSHIVLA